MAPTTPTTATTRSRIDVDRAAADRLLARHARALARVADVRERRQRAYALLARNGFDPSTAGDVARRFIDDSPASESASDPADGATPTDPLVTG